MDYRRSHSRGFYAATLWEKGRAVSALVAGAVRLVLAGAFPVAASAQQATAPATSLVFAGGTGVDVDQGKLVPDQRVGITGNRIEAVESMDKGKTPKGAQVWEPLGRDLIPA